MSWLAFWWVSLSLYVRVCACVGGWVCACMPPPSCLFCPSLLFFSHLLFFCLLSTPHSLQLMDGEMHKHKNLGNLIVSVNTAAVCRRIIITSLPQSTSQDLNAVWLPLETKSSYWLLSELLFYMPVS